MFEKRKRNNWKIIVLFRYYITLTLLLIPQFKDIFLCRRHKRGEHYELTQQEILDEIKGNESYEKRRAERMAVNSYRNGDYHSRHQVTKI